MLRVAFIGWRGMVGSVLMERMRAEGDFQGFEGVFFTTSQAGQKGPDVGMDIPELQDAYDSKMLSGFDIIITCQGGSYTEKVYPELKSAGWDGYWIDSASTLRMADDAILVLDPVNRDVIDRGLSSGVKNYIGANCTVALMLMGLSGLFKHDLVEWLTTMTYQAISGAGAKNMKELISQFTTIGDDSRDMMANPDTAIIDLDSRITRLMNDNSFPVSTIGAPLAGSLIPWIDREMENGQSKEEWKGVVETNKILGTRETVPVDGICVRIGTMRCHSQALTIKLKKDVPVDEITEIISGANDWVKVVPNTKEASIKELSPASVSGNLLVPVGRIRKMNLGPEFLTLFTVGDQLFWGAAEPLRRIFKIILNS